MDSARKNLMKRFKLSEIQAQAILDMRLQRLTGLERKKIEDEYRDLLKLIERLKAILANKALRMQVVKEELLALKEKYGDARRTQIVTQRAKSKSMKELLQEDQFIIAISYQHNIKRFSISDYENDSELIKASGTRDFTIETFLSSNSHYLLFFTNKGYCYPLRTSFVPTASSDGSGTPLSRLLNLRKGEVIINTLEIAKFDETQFVMMATRQGQVKRILLSTLAKPKEGGFVSMSIKGDDEVVSAVLTNGENEVILATEHGMAIRFSEQDVRDMGLTAGGVRGITLMKDDQVITMTPITSKKASIFTVTQLGFGKRSELKEFSTIKRGGKGIIAYKVTDKVGLLVALLPVEDKDQIFLITKRGKIKRQRAKSIKKMGRATQGSVIASIAQNDVVQAAIYAPQQKFSK